MMDAQATAEHRWLLRMVGEWETEGRCTMGPDQPEMTTRGTETVRALGEFWVVGDGRGEMPGGGEAVMQITIGFDPAKGKFVGTFVGSMMTMMWVYEGTLEGDVLTLNATGPDFTDPTKTTEYKDIVELKPDGTRTLTSKVQALDGSWQQIMTATYRRKG